MRDGKLFMAGYVGTIENWEKFTVDWVNVLSSDRPIKYFRMFEAQALKGEFLDWQREEVNDKIRQLSAVIRRYPFMSYGFIIDIGLFNKHVKPYAPYGLGNPYLSAAFSVVSGLARHFSNQQVRSIHYIFDNQQVIENEIELLFFPMLKNLPKSAQKLILEVPKFADDMTCIPLQAADMVAWTERRLNDMGIASLPLPISVLAPQEYHLESEITEEVMITWGNQFQKIQGVELLKNKSSWTKTLDVIRKLNVPAPVTKKTSTIFSRVNQVITALLRKIFN